MGARRSMHWAMMAMAVSAFGCRGDGVEIANESSTSTGSMMTTHGAPVGCDCVLQGTVELVADCAEPVCPHVSYESEGDTDPDLVDPAALECALVALRDRTPGFISWTSGDGGQYEYSGYVLIEADDMAIRRTWSVEDLGEEIGDAVLGRLPPPEAYESCLALVDDEQRFECMRQELATSEVVCDEGWEACPFCART